MNKYIVFLILFVISIISDVSGASVLINQNQYNVVAVPVNYTSCVNVETTCISSHFANNTQNINTSIAWGTVYKFDFWGVRVPALNSVNVESPTLLVEVFKSSTLNFADAVIFDTASYNLANTAIQKITFNLDADIQITDNASNLLVRSIWIRMSQPGYNASNVDGQRNNALGFFASGTTNTDPYPGGLLMGKGATISTYIPLAPQGNEDLSFVMYGTYVTPDEPPGPPGDTTEPPTELPCDDCDPYPGDPGGNESFFIPDFGNNTIYCPDCIGNETKNSTAVIKPGSGFCASLISFGYGSLDGCDAYSYIDFLYDYSLLFFILSIIAIGAKIWYISSR